MAYDFKKKFKQFYQPKNQPEIIHIPEFKFLAIEGQGNPNQEGGAYKVAVGKLYMVAYALRMSNKTDYKIPGYFEYVVPPLEGFWWQGEFQGYDIDRKDDFNWISCLRVPDFIRQEDVTWAKKRVVDRKQTDCSDISFKNFEEGLCVQMMHIGPYDSEIESVKQMEAFIEQQGYIQDFSSTRRHHEIYLSDPNRVKAERLKTILRHPVRKK